MKDCVFCKIILKELSAKVIFEDNNTIAFETIQPVSKGHLLVVPKNHFENIFDIDKDSLNKLMEVVKDLSQKIKVENKATGVNLLNASGKDAQQSVFHFHLHIVPRYKDDGLDLWFREKL